MKLIVGLGNPGKEYVRTLHNVGFRVVEALAAAKGGSWTEFSTHSRTCRLPETGATLLEPTTFMNESGTSVQELMSYFKTAPQDLWVVHDDLDLPVGEVRVSFDSASAGHRGVQSIIDTLGTKGFWRFRVGIGRPASGIGAEDYVLERPSQGDEPSLNAGEGTARTLIELALAQGTEAARHGAHENKLPPTTSEG